MSCIECTMAEVSPELSKAAWELSSATTLEEAKAVDDPPSMWAGLLMGLYHDYGHNFDAALAAVSDA